VIALAGDVARRGGDRVRGVREARARGEDQQHPCVEARAQQALQHLDRRAVGPVQILEHQHQRRGPGEALEQVAHRAYHQAVERVALDGVDARLLLRR